MTQDKSTSHSSTGLWFYWFERKPGEEHKWYWAQLCGSMHRLAFLREELTAVKRIPATDLALQRLAYHMETYLIRVYELRERAARLFATVVGYNGKMSLLKGKRIRQNTRKKLTNVDQDVSETYLELLSLIDDDIDLRNQNTHDTFLSLGLLTEHDVYDPQDALLDVQHQNPDMYDSFKKRVREEIRKTVKRYDEKIAKINRLIMKMLDQMDFIDRVS